MAESERFRRDRRAISAPVSRGGTCDGRGLYASAYRPFVSCGSSIHSGMASPPAAPPAETGLRACSGSLRAWSGKTLGTLSPNLCQGGQAPLGFPSVGGYREQDFDSCLAVAPCVDDRPPTHFFVKKKFIPTGGAETATQKVPSGLCEAHTLCGTGTTPHAGWSFFLYEKSVLRESDYLRGRKPEVSTDSTPPLFPPLKKPLK